MCSHHQNTLKQDSGDISTLVFCRNNDVSGVLSSAFYYLLIFLVKDVFRLSEISFLCVGWQLRLLKYEYQGRAVRMQIDWHLILISLWWP